MRKQCITKYGYVDIGHWALGTGYWVGGSGVVKLSFYRSNPGERTTVPDRIPQVYMYTSFQPAAQEIVFMNAESNIVQGSIPTLLRERIVQIKTSHGHNYNGKVLVLQLKISHTIPPQLKISHRVALWVKTSRGHRA